MFAALTVRDPRLAEELSHQPDLNEALETVLLWTNDLDPFGFGNGPDSQSRPEEARRLGIGKLERSLVRAAVSVSARILH